MSLDWGRSENSRVTQKNDSPRRYIRMYCTVHSLLAWEAFCLEEFTVVDRQFGG
jgi:hypothetical protein